MKRPTASGLLLLALGPLCAQPLLTLPEALTTALAENRSFRVAEAEAAAAAEDVGLGEAGFLPQVDAAATHQRSLNDTRVESSLAQRPTTEVDGAASEATTAGVTGTWTIFSGLSSFAAYDRLSAQARLADLRKRGTRQDLIAAVIDGYGDVVRQQRLLETLDTALALSRERVKLTEGKYGLGSASKLELLQAKLDLNADLSARLRQAESLADSKRALNLLLARPDSTGFAVSDSIPLLPLPPYEGLKAAAMEGSPAILQAGQGERLARASLREYTGGLFPKLDLNAGYNYALNENEAGLTRLNRSLGWTYGASLRFNLFDGFVLPGDFRSARLSVRRAGLLAQDARARIESGMAEAYAAYRASLEVLQLEASNVELARENVGIAMQRLRLGTIASLELRTAQENFIRAEGRLVSARFESKRAETDLLRLAGRLEGPTP